MIGFFEDPLPDELLYSACARYSDRLKSPNVATAAQELFGGKNGMALVAFPNRLDHLLAVMPPGHNYTTDRFIDHNTPLRFYSPFIPPERIRVLREDMKGDGDNRIYSRLGINTGRIPLPSSLRFCPGCVADDRNKYKKAYWHRIHQLPGIEVCPHHSAFLESSKALWKERHNSNEFVSAERVIHEVEPRLIDPRDKHHAVLLKLAQDAMWLLNWDGAPIGNDVLRSRYYNLLLKKGFAYYNGRVKHTELLNAFVDFYSAQFLERLHSSISLKGECWLLRMVRSHRVMAVQSPLRHLLLITFLGCTPEELFTRYEEYLPFGRGPWPCLNRASVHFGENVIADCRVIDGEKKNKGKPLGTFSCTCGFMYLRVGPDTKEEDRHRFVRVLSYGKVWEDNFKQNWNDPSITLTELAEQLNVIPFTLRRHAIRLKLRFPRPGRYSRPTTEEVIEKYSNTLKTFDEALRSRQKHWLSVRKNNPKATRRKLMSIASYTYEWLSRHAPVWLEENMPKARRVKPPPVRVDWKKWDGVIMKAVNKTAAKILGLSGRPTRVSKEAIIRKVGHRSWIEQRIDKLPLTTKALEKCIESNEDFLMRRVKWAESYFCKKGICPTRHQFSVEAGTRTISGNSPRVQEAISDALERLR